MPHILYACVCEKKLAVLNVPQCVNSVNHKYIIAHITTIPSCLYVFIEIFIFLLPLFSFSLTSTFKDIVIIIIFSLTVSTFAGRKVGREKRVERKGGR